MDEVWLFTVREARASAQQHTVRGTRRLYWYVDPLTPQANGVPLRQMDMEAYLIANVAPRYFL